MIADALWFLVMAGVFALINRRGLGLHWLVRLYLSIGVATLALAIFFTLFK